MWAALGECELAETARWSNLTAPMSVDFEKEKKRNQKFVNFAKVVVFAFGQKKKKLD